MPDTTGEIMGAVELCASRFARVLLQSGTAKMEDDDAFCRLIYQFTVNKMILKYQNRGERNTN